MKKSALSILLLLVPVMAQASDLPSKTSAPKAPAKGASLFDGFVGGDFGQQSTDHSYSFGPLSESFDTSGKTYGLHGSFATMLAPQFGLQVDADFRSATHEIDEANFNFDVNTPSLAGHAFWRDSSTGLIGAFGQYSNSSNMLLFEDVISFGMERYLLGLDGQLFMGNATFYGQAAFMNSNLSTNLMGAEVEADGYVLTGQVRYFIDPNLMIALRASYSESSFNVEGIDFLDATTTSIGARAEYRMSNNPISVYADVSHDMSEASFNELLTDLKVDREESRFMIGVNVNFGGSTLLERDRSGASLNFVEPPHNPLVLFDLGGIMIPD